MFLIPCGGLHVSSSCFRKEDAVCMNVHGWLHLWITGLQGPQAKPFKAGHDFAAVSISRLPKVPRVGEPPVQLG